MKLVHNNHCIECNSAQIISRKIVPGAFINLNSIGRVFTYKCSRNSEAIIKRELNPKVALYNKNSFLDLETKLECDRLYFLVKAKKPYHLGLKNHTHRHKAEEIFTDDFTYARIDLQLNNIPIAIPPVTITLIDE